MTENTKSLTDFIEREIWTDDEKSIFVVKGVHIQDMLDELNNTFTEATIIPETFVKDPLDMELYLNSITVKMLISPFLVVHLKNLYKLKSALLKELTGGDFFQVAHSMINTKSGFRRKQLVIITNADLTGSEFYTDIALAKRTKILQY